MLFTGEMRTLLLRSPTTQACLKSWKWWSKKSSWKNRVCSVTVWVPWSAANSAHMTSKCCTALANSALRATKKKESSPKTLVPFLKLPQIRVLASQQFLPGVTRKWKLWGGAAAQSPFAAGKMLRPLSARTPGLWKEEKSSNLIRCPVQLFFFFLQGLLWE